MAFNSEPKFQFVIALNWQNHYLRYPRYFVQFVHIVWNRSKLVADLA